MSDKLKHVVSGTVLVTWDKCTVAMCWHINQGCWRGLGGGAGPFWLHKDTLTFEGPAA